MLASHSVGTLKPAAFTNKLANQKILQVCLFNNFTPNHEHEINCNPIEPWMKSAFKLPIEPLNHYWFGNNPLILLVGNIPRFKVSQPRISVTDFGATIPVLEVHSLVCRENIRTSTDSSLLYIIIFFGVYYIFLCYDISLTIFSYWSNCTYWMGINPYIPKQNSVT